MVQLSVCSRPSSALLMSWSIWETALSRSLRSLSATPIVVGVDAAVDGTAVVAGAVDGALADDDELVVDALPLPPHAASSKVRATAPSAVRVLVMDRSVTAAP
jgi:hypothetical protein